MIVWSIFLNIKTEDRISHTYIRQFGNIKNQFYRRRLEYLKIIRISNRILNRISYRASIRGSSKNFVTDWMVMTDVVDEIRWWQARNVGDNIWTATSAKSLWPNLLKSYSHNTYKCCFANAKALIGNMWMSYNFLSTDNIGNVVFNNRCWDHSLIWNGPRVRVQAELGKKIVSRAIEPDMKPILPTFSGLEPESIISSPYQDASTIRPQSFGSLRLIFKFKFSSGAPSSKHQFENSSQLFQLVQFIHQTWWSTVQRDVR